MAGDDDEEERRRRNQELRSQLLAQELGVIGRLRMRIASSLAACWRWITGR